jgi:hypothetical protein
MTMPFGIVRHPTSENDPSETQPKRKFDRLRIAADIVQRLREAGISCDLSNPSENRE